MRKRYHHCGAGGWTAFFSRTRSLAMFSVAAPTFVLLHGCSGEMASTSRENMEAWKAELMEADHAFDVATAERGVEGWVSFFSPQGAMVVQGVGEVQGLDPIREIMEAGLSDPSVRLTWTPMRAEVSESGDLGYTVGRFQNLAVDSAGVSQVFREGVYVSIWRRQADGNWKVEMDLGNPTD